MAAASHAESETAAIDRLARGVAGEQLGDQRQRRAVDMALGVEQQARVAQHHHAVAEREQRERAARRELERVGRDLRAADAHALDHRELVVLERDTAELLHRTRQGVARERHQPVARRPLGVGPERHLGRLVERGFEQLVGQRLVVLEGDALDRAAQAEPVFVLLVIEGEVFVEHLAQDRCLDHVARQLRERWRRHIGIRPAEIDAERVDLAAEACPNGGGDDGADRHQRCHHTDADPDLVARHVEPFLKGAASALGGIIAAGAAPAMKAR